MAFHPWWAAFGHEVETADQLTPAAAQEFVSALAKGLIPGVTVAGLKQSPNMNHAAVHIEVDVERPQDLAYPIRATEPVAILFPFDGGQPRVLALRDDFPDTPHQNWTPPDAPCSLCIDDRPWNEARLTATAPDLVRRVQLWLAKAARGDLHDAAQPPDPLFFLSALALIMPPSVLAESADPTELVGFMRPDNPHFIITRPLSEADKRRNDAPGFVVLTFQAQPQTMTRLRHAPHTLAGLAEEMERCGVNLLEDLQTRLKAWAGIANDDVRRLSSRLAIVIAFPVTAGAGRTASDLRAFVSFDTVGEVGVALGVLYKNASRVGSKDAYVAAIGSPPAEIKPVNIEPAQVHFSFHRELAASVAGHVAPDRRRAVLVGAGSIGSQLAVNLAREGRFIWSIVDDDYVLPHNLARHALFSTDVGAPKAFALARQLGALLNESFLALKTNVIHPDEVAVEQLTASLVEADVIIDASASVAVSRHLADLPNAKARRVCVFFNPAGNSVAVLTESADRSITLRDLEAQYHRLVLTEPTLASHLQVGAGGVRYSGSCRTLTNRIPATRAALLSAIAARGIADGLAGSDASLRIWTTSENGQVHVVERAGAAVHSVPFDAWTISYGDDLLDDLVRLRAEKLPNETGGVLLGIADMSRKSIHLAYAMPQPKDSRGTPAGFERGVVGVLDEVNRAVEASMHQLRYVGEWHSHPRLSSAWPSAIDLNQLVWLGNELASEGLPGLMAIAADDGRYSIIVDPRDRQPSPEAQSRKARG